MEQFRVIIAGSRDFSDYNLLVEKCDKILKNKLSTHEVVIISGGARGADRLGESYATSLGLKLNRFLPDWDRYGPSAGYRRNAVMADNADALIAFWDGKSKGTGHMIDLAKQKGLAVRIINY